LTQRGSSGHGARRWIVDVDDDVVCRGCERRGRLHGVAVAHLGGDVVGRGVAQPWRAGPQRVERFGHRRQLFIVDEDRVGGGARGLACLGDDQRHGLADEAHTVVRQRAQRCRRGGAAVRAREPAGPGIALTPAATRSAPVYTASTPGMARALSTSIDFSTAWAEVERTNAACVCPGSEMSSANRPRPLTSVGSSIRRTAWPLPKRPGSITTFMVAAPAAMVHLHIIPP
jgi:hypothetical protein